MLNSPHQQHDQLCDVHCHFRGTNTNLDGRSSTLHYQITHLPNLTSRTVNVPLRHCFVPVLGQHPHIEWKLDRDFSTDR